MDRKQFLIKFWDNVLKPIFLLIIFIIIVKNFNQIIDLGKFFGAFAGILIAVYLITFIFVYFTQELYENLPEKFKLFLKSLNPYFKKLSYLLWILLISYIIFNWNYIPLGNKVFIVSFIAFSIVRFFIKEIESKKAE